MRVFVTGASGWVGSAITRNLIGKGHQVLGMARSDAGAAKVAAAGAEVFRANLEDLESLRGGPAETDGTIHTAFSHDFSKFAQNGEDEKHAIAVLNEALAGSNKPLVVTSGSGLLNPGQLVTEDTLAGGGHGIPRDPETAAFASLDQGIRAMVVRLPPSTHGTGDHGFAAALVGIARDRGFAAYVGAGENHWPATHVTDAADVFVRALERGKAGSRYHAVAEQGVRFRDIAEAIGRGLNLPTRSLTPDEAAGHFGWFARFAAINNMASSTKTRAELGWHPTGPGLIADLDAGHYFKG